jgi:tetratricopeptide (TPR) repeat protein
MSVSLHILAKLHDNKKACILTYTDNTSRNTCTIDLPKLVVIASEAPFQYNEELGMAFYHLLDGDGRYLTQARDRARHADEKLMLRLELDTALQDLPFELLHDGRFLLPNEIHLVSLGLVEHDQSANTFWGTPLLREKLFGELLSDEQLDCHTVTCQYYKETLSPKSSSYFVEAEELVYHALFADETETVCKEGANLMARLHESLAYAESKRVGEWILASLPEVPETEDGGSLLNEIGITVRDMGDNRRAIGYFEQALVVFKKIFWEKHPSIAALLNNLGGVWDELGEKKKAISYYEQALVIDLKVFGEKYPNVARDLNNLGMALVAVEEFSRGYPCLQWAYEICLEFYGSEHPRTQAVLRNFHSME